MNAIAPIKSGSLDTLLGIAHGNEVIAAANGINGLTGIGQVQVLHAGAGLRISFLPDVPPFADDSLDNQTDLPAQ